MQALKYLKPATAAAWPGSPPPPPPGPGCDPTELFSRPPAHWAEQAAALAAGTPIWKAAGPRVRTQPLSTLLAAESEDDPAVPGGGGGGGGSSSSSSSSSSTDDSAGGGAMVLAPGRIPVVNARAADRRAAAAFMKHDVPLIWRADPAVVRVGKQFRAALADVQPQPTLDPRSAVAAAQTPLQLLAQLPGRLMPLEEPHTLAAGPGTGWRVAYTKRAKNGTAAAGDGTGLAGLAARVRSGTANAGRLKLWELVEEHRETRRQQQQQHQHQHQQQQQQQHRGEHQLEGDPERADDPGGLAGRPPYYAAFALGPTREPASTTGGAAADEPRRDGREVMSWRLPPEFLLGAADNAFAALPGVHQIAGGKWLERGGGESPAAGDEQPRCQRLRCDTNMNLLLG
eukprot:SAG22_NODE_1330_length_4709_cov_25.747722_3_plen_399_part_00